MHVYTILLLSKQNPTVEHILLKRIIKNKKFNIYIFRGIVYVQSKSDDDSVARNCENERTIH